MKTCAVIVTYGDRFHFLKQVIEACFKEGIDKIIVIDNAAVENSRKQLKKFEENKDKLKVIYLDKNTGSAGGYKRGLQEAYNCSECEFIWLLDDDNMPQKNSLKVLKEFWNNLNEENKEEKFALLSYRPDRVQYKEAIMTNNPNLVLGRKNSFLGFHVLDIPKKVIRVIKRKIGLSTFIEKPNIKSGKVAVAPYGGMFFHKNLIDNIGYPREEFFVYADDHEWSYRITKNNGAIYLVLDSKLKDIDTSFGLRGNRNTSFFYNMLNKSEESRLFFSIRNRIIFEKEFCNNKFEYVINRCLVNFIIKFYVNKKNKKLYLMYKKALKEGLKKRL